MMSNCHSCGTPTDWTIGDAIMECGTVTQRAHPIKTDYDRNLIGCCDKQDCISLIIEQYEKEIES